MKSSRKARRSGPSVKTTIALAILAIGIIVGIIAALSPIGSFSPQHSGFISPFNVDPNDYKTEPLQMAKGESVAFMVQLDNATIFRFYIMNSTQLTVYEKCAPKCMQPLVGGSGPYYKQYGLTKAPLYLNVTVTEASPFSDSFTAPSTGAYYFVFDNSEGRSFATYLGQNATGFTAGTLTVNTFEIASTFVANWRLAFLAVGEVLVGGTLATLLWEPKIKKSKPARMDKFFRKFGTIIAAVVIIAILVADSPIFLNSLASSGLIPGQTKSTTTAITNTSAVSNSSFFLSDADYLDNTGSNGFGSSTIDNQDEFLYTTAIANNSLYLYDLPDEAPDDVGGFNNPVSVLYVSQSYYQGWLYVSNAGNGTVDILSDNSTGGIFGLILQRLGEISLPMPGDIAYDSSSGLVYVAYGNGSQSGIGIIDQNTSSELGTIPLPAQPGQLAVEQNGTRIFANIPSLSEVDVIDKTTRQVIASWPIGSATGNVAMTLDETDDRLFVGTSNPATLVVLNDNSGQIIGSYKLTSAPGDLVYDPQSGLILASCVGGTLDGYQELNPNSFVFASSQESSPGATSSVLLSSLDQDIVAAPPYQGQPSQVFTFQIYPS